MVVKVVVVTVGGRSEPAQSWKGVEALTTSNPLNRTEQQQQQQQLPLVDFWGGGVVQISGGPLLGSYCKLPPMKSPQLV